MAVLISILEYILSYTWLDKLFSSLYYTWGILLYSQITPAHPYPAIQGSLLGNRSPHCLFCLNITYQTWYIVLDYIYRYVIRVSLTQMFHGQCLKYKTYLCWNLKQLFFRKYQRFTND